jgi:cell division protein FtsB
MPALRSMIIMVVMAAALIFLQFRLWFEDGGIFDMIRLKKMLSVQVSENDKLRKQNDELLFQIQRIQNSQDAAESRARSELGMMKKGETFYQVVKKTRKSMDDHEDLDQ